MAKRRGKGAYMIRNLAGPHGLAIYIKCQTYGTASAVRPLRGLFVWYVAGHVRAPRSSIELRPEAGGGKFSVTSLPFIMACPTDRPLFVT